MYTLKSKIEEVFLFTCCYAINSVLQGQVPRLLADKYGVPWQLKLRKGV